MAWVRFDFFSFLLLLWCLSMAAPAFSAPSRNTKYLPENASRITGVSDRGFFRYLTRLGISEKEVMSSRGKKWLSVGEGKSDFVAESYKRGVDAWALDVAVVNPHVPDRTKLGLAQNLPFSDQQFDRVVSVWLIEAFFNNKKFNDPAQGKRAIEEMIRVTKVGGDIRINPITEKGIIQTLDEMKQEGKISYEVLPYFKGAFHLKNNTRLFEIEPVEKSQEPGSVKIVRLK